MHWLSSYDWNRLRAGEKIKFTFRAHPRAYGFQKIVLADQVGQREDWALSLPDGSRLHLWLMPDGRWIMHRDAIDPARGPVHAVAHAATESSFGQFALGALLVFGVVLLIARGASA